MINRFPPRPGAAAWAGRENVRPPKLRTGQTAKAPPDKQAQPLSTVASPGPAIDTKALAGKTVYYVPLVLKASGSDDARV